MTMLTPLFNPNHDNFSGNVNAEFELLQFGDYQCLHCADMNATIRQLRLQYGCRIRYVFRNFPLLNLHRMSIDAAVAAEAAALQNRFWPMHDALLDNQKYLNQAVINRIAEEIGMNMRLFERCQTNRSLKNKITMDLESGIKSGVNGTPTFFINSLRFDDFHDFENLYRSFIRIAERSD